MDETARHSSRIPNSEPLRLSLASFCNFFWGIAYQHSPTDFMENYKPSPEKGRFVITGGTEGIGKEIAEEFLLRNNSVAICARTKENLERMKDAHPELIAQRIDLSDRHATKNFVQQVIYDLGGLDALILNAAIFDFDFKKRNDVSKDDVRKEMFQVNEVAQVALIRASKEALRKSEGVIVFITTRFLFKGIETAPIVDGQSVAAQEDIGQYLKNKKRMHVYLDDFIKDEQNGGIFVFSVIPGTVNTAANKRIIEMGTSEMRDAKLKERIEGKERDSLFAGRIIAKMTATRKRFNPETQQYDRAIKMER